MRSHARIHEIFVCEIWMKAGNGNWQYGCRSPADPRCRTVPVTSHISSSLLSISFSAQTNMTGEKSNMNWSQTRCNLCRHHHLLQNEISTGLCRTSHHSAPYDITWIDSRDYRRYVDCFGKEWISSDAHGFVQYERNGKDRTGQDRTEYQRILY